MQTATRSIVLCGARRQQTRATIKSQMTVRTAVRLYSDKKVEMPAVDFKAQPEMATERNNLRKNTQEVIDDTAAVPEIKIHKNLDAATAEPSARVAKLVEEILSLNIFEAAQLNKALQKALGITGVPMMAAAAAAPAPAAAAATAAAAAAPAAAAEPKKEEPAKPKAAAKMDVKLVAFPEANKFKVLKEIRALKPGMNLMESKTLLEGLPKIVVKELPAKQAEEWKKQLTDAGAEVELV